jgi:hypothetical protein
MAKALRRAMTPKQRQAGVDGRRILEQPLNEGSSLLHTGLLHLRDPGITRVASTRTDHAAQGLDLVLCEGHDWIETEETRQLGLISRAPILRFREKQACGPEGCQGRGRAFQMVRIV